MEHPYAYFWLGVIATVTIWLVVRTIENIKTLKETDEIKDGRADFRIRQIAAEAHNLRQLINSKRVEKIWPD